MVRASLFEKLHIHSKRMCILLVGRAASFEFFSTPVKFNEKVNGLLRAEVCLVCCV